MNVDQKIMKKKKSKELFCNRTKIRLAVMALFLLVNSVKNEACLASNSTQAEFRISSRNFEPMPSLQSSEYPIPID